MTGFFVVRTGQDDVLIGHRAAIPHQLRGLDPIRRGHALRDIRRSPMTMDAIRRGVDPLGLPVEARGLPDRELGALLEREVDSGRILLVGMDGRGGPIAHYMPSPQSHRRGVAEWSTGEKIEAALRRAIPLVPRELRSAVEAMLAPEAIAATVGILIAWGAAHAVGVGEVVDVALVAYALVVAGPAGVKWLREFAAVTATLPRARTEAEIDKAAKIYAQAIIGLGALFLYRFQKVARNRAKERTSGSSRREGGASSAPAQRRASLSSNRGSSDSKQTAPPAEKTLSAAALASQRRAVARDFYKSKAGWSDQRIDAHLKGIDFNQPVEVVTLPKGTRLTQHQINGVPGDYFAPPGTRAEILGIRPEGRVPVEHVLTEDVQMLKSTAADIKDWGGSGAILKGGGTQYFSTEAKQIAKVIP